MNALVLDGSEECDTTLNDVCEVLVNRLEGFGWKVHIVVVRDTEISDCSGEFECFARTAHDKTIVGSSFI